MAKFPVAIVKYDKTLNSLRKAVELCNGFEELKPNSKVLLKPNIGGGGTPKVAPYAIVTTSRMVEDLIQLLHEHGCKDISIGEGAVLNKELGSNTPKGYKWSGIARAAKKYGVKLIDFHDESYQNVELDGAKIRISSVALESDFLINFPVLKTHVETKVSLGLKNLKGCLDMRSRREFHRKGLERMIALLNTKVKPKLTIIDGIYALERGPDFIMGTAHRMNLVIAGKDALSCDIVGSTVLGIEPSSVAHLKEFAAITGRQLDIGTIDVRGESIKEVTKRLEWRVNLEDVFFRPARIGGVTFQFLGTSVCSGCHLSVEGALMAFCKDNKGTDLDNVEICIGSEVKAKKESKRVFLVGSCAIEANRDLGDAIRIKGCPPKTADTLLTLMNHTIDKGKARRILALRTIKLSLTKLGLYDEDFPLYKHYALPEFDREYFYT
jgi:uncharacterized protein (DUF362 family)